MWLVFPFLFWTHERVHDFVINVSGDYKEVEINDTKAGVKRKTRLISQSINGNFPWFHDCFITFVIIINPPQNLGHYTVSQEYY